MPYGQLPFPLMALTVGSAVPLPAIVTACVAGDAVYLIEPIHTAFVLALVPSLGKVTCNV